RFNSANGLSRVGLIRLNPDGTNDTSFAGSVIPTDGVTAILLQPDGKFLISGTSIQSGNFYYSLVRLNPDGTRDQTFTQANNTGARGKAIAVQPDGKILFSSETGLVRYNTDGTTDPSFTSAVNFPFESLAVLPDGKILAGGSFSFSY